MRRRMTAVLTERSRVVNEPVNIKPNKWNKLDGSEKDEAIHAAFIWLMSDFLFSCNNLPDCWLEYLKSEHMIDFRKALLKDDEFLLQDKVLTDTQLTVIKMLFTAHEVLKSSLKIRQSVTNLIEFVTKIDFPSLAKNRSVAQVKHYDQIDKMCSALLDLAQTFPPNGEPEPGFDFNLYEFAKSQHRRLMVSVLVGRSIGIIVCRVCQTGNMKLVRDIMSVCTDMEQSVWIRKNGNAHFQNRRFEKAIEAYTRSLEITKYNAIAYCNRCQAALNVKNYKLAISDGYRAIALNPTWGKAYYRLSEAYKENNCFDEAKFINQRGLQMSKDYEETEELKKQLQKLIEISRNRLKENFSSALTNDPGTSKKKKAKKNKKKNAKDKIEEPSEIPSLLSDNDSMKEISDNEVDVVSYFKYPQREITRRTKLREEEEEMRKNKLKNLLPEMLEKNHQLDRVLDETILSDPDDDYLGLDLELNSETKHENKKSSSKRKNTFIKEIEKPKEPDPLKSFNSYRTNASKALISKNFESAITCYEEAIEVLEKLDTSKVSTADRFVLFYSRGFASLEIRKPPDIARSLDHFAKLLKPNKGNDNHSHPVLYYAIAYAQYLLNNFYMVAKPLQTGLKMLEGKQIKPLVWPGLDVVIPESKPDYLKKLMEDLLQDQRYPPKPDAVCSYEKCEKAERNDSSYYDICDKDVNKKEIYQSDFNFEGYIKLHCSWNCVSCFHLKCWNKFKFDNFKKHGDKDVLDSSCLTDGCDGIYCRVIMTDELNKEKKNVASEKPQTKEEPKKSSIPKMTKSERNLSKRTKQLKEVKQKKQMMKQKIDNEAEVPAKPKKEKIYTDDDIANAKVLKRETKEVIHSTKTKSNKPKSKKRPDKITLNAFLEQSKDRLNTTEIEQEILASRSANAPFQIPDELIDEVEEFENSLSSEEVFWTSCLYEYFENFFETNGPVKVQDDLLIQQQLLLPEKMREIIEKHSDIISFLLKNQYRFHIVAPYIGLPSQQEQLNQLAEEFQLSLQPRVPNRNHLSTLDALDCDFDGPANLSDFARDLYNVGEVPLSDVQNITGLGQFGGMELDRFDDPIDVISPLNDAVNVQPVDSLCTKMDEFLEGDTEFRPRLLESLSSQSNPPSSTSSTSSDETNQISLKEEKPEPRSYAANSTQTDVGSSYFDEMKVLLSKNLELQSEIEELKYKNIRVTNESMEVLSTKTKELEDAKATLLRLQQSLAQAYESIDFERRNMTEERSALQNTIQSTNDLLLESRRKEKEQSDLFEEVKEKLKKKEEDCDKISIIYQTQRASWLEEKTQISSEKDHLSAQLQQANVKTTEAEIKVLENDKNHAIKTLLRARSECEKIVLELEKLIRNYSNNSQAQAEVMKGYRKWKTNIDTCTQYAEQTKQQFEANCELLRSGKNLSELNNIQPLIPPPPGPSIQQVAAAAMHVASLGSHRLGNNLFHPPRPSGSLLMNGNDRIHPPIKMPRMPQPPIGTGKQGFPAPSTSPMSVMPTSVGEPLTSVPQPKAGSFEKIMLQLQTLFPSVSRQDLALCIKDVRQNNNNSLAGLSFENIVQQASLIVQSKKLSPKINLASGSNLIEDDPCVICHEPMPSAENHKLRCGHEFHRSCLAQWLERNRTCPTCRDYAVDTKEFPSLGNLVNRS